MIVCAVGVSVVFKMISAIKIKQTMQAQGKPFNAKIKPSVSKWDTQMCQFSGKNVKNCAEKVYFRGKGCIKDRAREGSCFIIGDS